MNPRRPRPLSFRRMALVFVLASTLGGVGCATGGVRAKTLVPTLFQTPTGPFVVFTNFPMEKDASQIQQLRQLERQVEDTLGLTVREDLAPIEVYILDDRETYEHFLATHYPSLPARRAFFLANGHKRVVYTFKGERLDEDLRHEATHALLNMAIGDMPLWLDEGLAEYFESTADRTGWNPEHIQRLPGDLSGRWTPDLKRLESFKNVKEMTPRDYRESWAWVHFLLNDSAENKTILLGYLGDLRTEPHPRPLSQRLPGGPGTPQRLMSHLRNIHQPALTEARPAPRSGPTVRLQNSPAPDAVEPAPRKKGFFQKVRSFLGF